jgi:L-iditol 2-dehydrogenase
MRAVVFRGVGSIHTETLPDPELKRGEALLRVKAAAICGTDVRIARHGHHLIPHGTWRILGHEIAGVIEAVSSEAGGLKPGTPVAVAPNIHCGSCIHCISGNTHLCEHHVALGIGIDGGFAEYMVLPAKAIAQGNVIAMKEGTDFAQAALNEPLSCCFNSLEYTGFSLGETLLVIGAGPIGIMHTILANRMGAARVIVSEVSEERLKDVKGFGADVLINPAKQGLKEAVLEETHGRGVDVAIVACPVASAHNQALECLAPLGRLNIFGGLPKENPMTIVDANRIHYNYLKIVGTSRQSIGQYMKTLLLIEAGKIDLRPLVTGSFTLEQAEDAFKRSADGDGLKNLFVL